jgi:hypothetical protein
VSKGGKSCTIRPTCGNWGLHKLRKTFATMHSETGVPRRPYSVGLVMPISRRHYATLLSPSRVFLLDPADALLFYMDGGIVRVRVDNDTYWVNYQLGELEQVLASRGFFRARRSSLSSI